MKPGRALCWRWGGSLYDDRREGAAARCVSSYPYRAFIDKVSSRKSAQADTIHSNHEAPMNTRSAIELDEALASKFARVALGHLTREYPNKLDHVMASAADVQSPARAASDLLWQLSTGIRASMATGCSRVSAIDSRACPKRRAIRALFDEHVTEANVAAEVAYLRAPRRARFRAAVWLGVAARARRPAPFDAHGRSRALGEHDAAARRRVRRALHRIPAEVDLSAAGRDAFQYGVRAVAGDRLRAADARLRRSRR